MLRALIAAGVDVFRLNFSHGTHESHAANLSRRSARPPRDGRRHVAIMQDLSGPKIRTGPLDGGEPLMLTDGASCGSRPARSRRAADGSSRPTRR